jgi:hypothetical protein
LIENKARTVKKGYRAIDGKSINTWLSLSLYSFTKQPRRMPCVLSEQEVRQVLLHLKGKYWLITALLYGEDKTTGQNFDYRRGWVKDTLLALSQIFTVITKTPILILSKLR